MPTFSEALLYWLKLGFISFGGPAGQISLMHRELVEKRRWISETHFFHALNFCMLLPGPEAQQLATYLGWRLHEAKGGIIAGTLFVLPSVVILMVLSWAYMQTQSLPWLAALLAGVTPAVVAIVFSALLRMGKRTLKTPVLWTLAAGAFLAVSLFHLSFLWLVPMVALVGWLGGHYLPQQFPASQAQHGSHHHTHLQEQPVAILPPTTRQSLKRVLQILSVGITLWWLPVLITGHYLGWESTHAHQGLFFSQTALVTFGGAYAVLPHVAQHAVEHHGWLSHTQMMAGLALAETTPGPLIMVLQFVGFVGGWQQPGTLSPPSSATWAALLTTWVTFVPSFIFIFLGGPHIEQMHRQPRLSSALAAITAAVVGLLLHLAVRLSMQAFLLPSGAWNGLSLLLAGAALVALEHFKVGLLPVLLSCAGLALAWQLWVLPALGY